MECQVCQLQQRTFVCDKCVKNSLRDYRQRINRFGLERDTAVAKATTALSGAGNSGTNGMESARTFRATVSSLERRVSELMDGLAALRKENEQKRDRLQTFRTKLAERRQTLTAAKTMSASPSVTVSSVVISAHASLASLSSSIAHARTGLVQELVEVFGISHDDTHWTIANLILPVPGDMRRYPPDHLNAVLTPTIHFLNLLAFYLGVKLPFHITWTQGKLGVGLPYIGAVKGVGSESGGWARWYQQHPLHVSASSLATPAPSSPFTSITLPQTEPTSSASSDAGSPSASTSLANVESMIFDPHLGIDPSIMQNRLITSSFTTGIAMLLYNVSYLAYTQHGVNVPLHQVAAGDVLSTLWGICFGISTDYIRYSHETASSLTPNPCSFPLHRLPPPTPPAFALEFGQLLQAMSRPTPKSTVQAQGMNYISTPNSISPSYFSKSSTARPVLGSSSATRPQKQEKAKRRASEVSLTKNIMKNVKSVEMSPFREDDHEGGEGGRQDDDGWDLV
ncbi:UV radiation resistance protein and autophagy-related subunit 14-domain-containing protein [Lentinula aff. detonsa]|uniref:Autophagy-related protein 14 n=1 Tax=Lentinula aff. detonsa TaxID=2804958 RepID=A0AA38NPD5_9AGAR|nr:UV radiation resistance protein and autophagy-related subunit 14-domain-containing protein [Lentinula aff. detonsa]KAJ3795359.1 UV radiation resistance protein and autophagy-related subunit 14-domain-containing protein [Lentinula aff. detonsa]